MHSTHRASITSSGRIDTLRIAEVRLDTVYRMRTQRVTELLSAYDTIRMTDTVMRADTIYVKRDIADSLARACRAHVGACEARVSNLRAQVQAYEADMTTLRTRQTLVPWLVAGAFVTGILIAR